MRCPLGPRKRQVRRWKERVARANSNLLRPVHASRRKSPYAKAQIMRLQTGWAIVVWTECRIPRLAILTHFYWA